MKEKLEKLKEVAIVCLVVATVVLIAVFFNRVMNIIRDEIAEEKEADGIDMEQVKKDGYAMVTAEDGSEIKFEIEDFGEINTADIEDHTVSENTLMEWEETSNNKMEDIVKYLTKEADTVEYDGFEISETDKKVLENIRNMSGNVYVLDSYNVKNNETIYVNSIVTYDMQADGMNFVLQILKFYNSGYMIEISDYSYEFEERYMDNISNEDATYIIESKFLGYLKDYLSSDDETAKKKIEESCNDGKIIKQLEDIKKEVYKCDKHFEVEVDADNNIGIKVYTLNKDKITYNVKYEHKVTIEYNNKERKYLIKGVE